MEVSSIIQPFFQQYVDIYKLSNHLKFIYYRGVDRFSNPGGSNNVAPSAPPPLATPLLIRIITQKEQK